MELNEVMSTFPYSKLQVAQIKRNQVVRVRAVGTAGFCNGYDGEEDDDGY